MPNTHLYIYHCWVVFVCLLFLCMLCPENVTEAQAYEVSLRLVFLFQVYFDFLNRASSSQCLLLQWRLQLMSELHPL